MLSAVVVGLAACTGTFTSTGGAGGGDDDDDVPPTADAALGAPDANQGPPPSYSLAVDPVSAELTLGETKTFTVTVTSEYGFAGPVTLAAAGVPATWQTTFAPSATVPLTADGQATATLEVTIPTDAESGAAMLNVTADASVGPRMAPPADVTVTPTLILRIPPNALNNPDTSFGGTKTVRYVAPGTTVTWINDDTVNHRIHADDVNGFDHQQNEMNAGGGSYSVQIMAPGVYDYNCHLHSQMVGQIVVSP